MGDKPKRRGRPRVRGTTTQMNVRVDHDLKVRGDEVLRACGTNPTDIISRLWSYMVSMDEVPEFLTEKEQSERTREFDHLGGTIRELRGMPWRALGSAKDVNVEARSVTLEEVVAACDWGERVRAKGVSQI